MSSKDEIRQMMIGRKAEMTAEEAEASSLQLALRLFATQAYKEADIVFAYMSANQEVRMQPVIERALADGKRAAVPVTLKDRQMEFVYLDSITGFIEKNGIKEPAGGQRADLNELYSKKILVILPGLAFGRDGSRIGYGGGYYDRYLERMDRAGLNYTCIALCFDFQLLDSLPEDAHDRRAEQVISGSVITYD